MAMKVQSTTKYIKVDLSSYDHPTLLSLFKTDKEELFTENIARSDNEWVNLLDRSIPKRPICKQGINLNNDKFRLRFGVFMSEDLCKENWADVWIGVGGEPLYCTDKYDYLSAGGHCCLVACEDRGTFAMAYLFIQ